MNVEFWEMPNPFSEVRESPLALLELEIMQMSGTIRDKPNWQDKINQPEITTKWLKEAEQQNISTAKMQFALDFTKYLATQAISPIVVSPVEQVYQSYQLIPKDLAQTFHTLALQLETQMSEKDYQPNSNNQVLNLIHPSMYCLVHYVTRFTTDEQYPYDLNEWRHWLGTGEIINYERTGSTEFWSESFQWLPSDFYVHEDGTVDIDSYINNLHPHEFPQLYSCIGSIFAKFVPLFEHVLTYFNNRRPVMIDLASHDHWQNRTEKNWYQCEPVPPSLPDNFDFESLNNDFLKNMISLRGTDLQVIVKMANIELSPEQPHYPGGSWHVEGMENEGIVATGIYYYECQNITNSKLSFRHAVSEPKYEQYDNFGMKILYGLGRYQTLNQTLGSVSIGEGRCIAFPNNLQHQVQPFELLDKTKCGSRKILVFFLINPNKTILSTFNVPPQQRSWMHKEINVKNNQPGVGSFLVPSKNIYDGCIKSTISRNVDTFIDWPMSHETALIHRLELMQERKYVLKNNTIAYEREFDLCEH